MTRSLTQIIIGDSDLILQSSIVPSILRLFDFISWSAPPPLSDPIFVHTVFYVANDYLHTKKKL